MVEVGATQFVVEHTALVKLESRLVRLDRYGNGALGKSSEHTSLARHVSETGHGRSWGAVGFAEPFTACATYVRVRGFGAETTDLVDGIQAWKV
jgi:hypothetical protein